MDLATGELATKIFYVVVVLAIIIAGYVLYEIVFKRG